MTQLISLFALSVLSLLMPACGAHRASSVNTARQVQQSDRIPNPQADEALLRGVDSGNADEVERALRDGANPNVADRNRFTVLMTSAIRGDERIVGILLKASADVNAQSNTQASALKMAILGKQRAVVEMLLAHGADPNLKDNGGRTVLHNAVEQGQIEIVRALLSRGADPNARENSLGRTPLFVAIGEDGLHGKKAEMSQLLIESGAGVNAKDNQGWTPLMEAVDVRSLTVTELLLNHGADVNAKDKDGWTALKQALLVGCPDIVELLEKAGARE